MKTEELYRYAETCTTPEPPLLARLNRETHLTQVYPQMLSGHLQGTFLRMISHMIRPARILEIGTFTGYSAISLAMGMLREPGDPGNNGILHTIEVNPEQEEMIRAFVHESGLEKQIMLHFGNARDIIPTLKETWDLVFIDADKPGYPDYYRLVFPQVRAGGFIVADNVFWDGKVLEDPAKMDKDTRAICRFNEMVMNDDRVENVMIPLRDGLMIARKLR